MSSSCCFWLSLDPIQTDSPENKEKLLQKKLSKHPTQTVVLVFCIQKLINRLGKKKIRLETSPDKSFVGMICKVRSGSEKNSFGSRALLSGSKFFRILDPTGISESLVKFFGLKIFKIFFNCSDVVLDRGCSNLLTAGPRILNGKISGSGINFPDPQHCLPQRFLKHILL